MPVFTTRPEIRGTFGVVATTHWLASSVAMGVLEKGGNAFDAAVAAGFTLQVVEPHLNGPLGEAPILIYSARERQCRMICGQGVAPQAATIAHYKGLGLDLIPGTGLLAATVPGAFDGWARLARDWGTRPLAELMEPALGYAENGYPVVPRIRDTIMTVAQLFRTEWTTSAAVYLPNGSPPIPGRLFRNPALAATYRRVLAEMAAEGGDRERQIERARDAWYKGFVAEIIDRFCRTEKVLDASGRHHGGVLTADDMVRWRAPVEMPLTYDYRGYTVVKGGPWSQGPVLLQQLALLSGFDLDHLDPVGPEFVHLVTECAKLAYADREAWYGDPDFVDVPMATLLSAEYNDARRKLVGDRASLELRPGRPDGREPHVLIGGMEVVAAARGVEHLFAAAEAVDRFGDKAAVPRVARPLDAALAVAAAGRRLGQHAAIGRRQRRVAEQPAGQRRAAAGQVDRRRTRPLAAKQLGDGHDRVADARHQRMALLRVAERRFHQLGERQRAVVEREARPGIERAGHAGGEQPGTGNEVEAEFAEARDRRRLRRHALAADHPAMPLFRAVDEDRRLTQRAVQMRFDDLQGETGGDRRVERVAALFEDAHRHRRGEPMGRRDDPERAADLGPRGETGHGVSSDLFWASANRRRRQRVNSRIARSMPARVKGNMRSSIRRRIMPMLVVPSQYFSGTGLSQTAFG